MNEIIKSFHWIVTSKCNYRCSYCFGKDALAASQTEHSSDAVVEGIYRLLDQLQGSWQVKLCGGEATIHPRFLEICRHIVSTEHTLSMTTNFSAPQAKLAEFLDIVGDRLDFVTASMHPGQIKNMDEFIDKAVWFQKAKPARTNFFVTTVLVEENFDSLCRIEQKLKEKGVTFKYQIQRVKGKHVRYPDKIEAYIKERDTENKSIRGKDFFGTRCHTGQYYFIVDPKGDVKRCSMPQDGSTLGNVVRGTFRRLEKPEPCLAHRCICAAPANRQMILYGNKVKGMSLAASHCRAILREFEHADARILIRAVLKRIGLIRKR